MKSIIEQASSIMKAIEKAWDRAENPKEFSIKIFEKEERNFFGMSVKPAKVGIFFTDGEIVHEKSVQKPRQEIKECRPELVKKDIKVVKQAPVQQPQQKQQAPRSERIKNEQPRTTATQSGQKAGLENSESAAHNNNLGQQQVHDKQHRTPAAWSEGMITTAHNWLKKTLSLIGMNDIHFSSEIAGKNLKLTFNMPLCADPVQEKQLFRSFAHLIMSSLRNQYKQEIKDLKVILIRPE